MPWGLLSLL